MKFIEDEHGTHPPEQTPHLREQLQAKAIDAVKSLDVDGLEGDAYGLVIIKLHEEGLELMQYTWAGPPEHALILRAAAEELYKVSNMTMRRDIELYLEEGDAPEAQKEAVRLLLELTNPMEERGE